MFQRDKSLANAVSYIDLLYLVHFILSMKARGLQHSVTITSWNIWYAVDYKEFDLESHCIYEYNKKVSE